jgi:hypothetical protein
MPFQIKDPTLYDVVIVGSGAEWRYGGLWTYQEQTYVCSKQVVLWSGDSRFITQLKKPWRFLSETQCFFKFRSFGDFDDAAWGGN